MLYYFLLSLFFFIWFESMTMGNYIWIVIKNFSFFCLINIVLYSFQILDVSIRFVLFKKFAQVLNKCAFSKFSFFILCFCFFFIKVLVRIIPKFFYFHIKFFPIILIMNSKKFFFLYFDFNLIFQGLIIIFLLFVFKWHNIINICLVILKMYIWEHLKFLGNLFKRSF